jgi:hypothetical protein
MLMIGHGYTSPHARVQFVAGQVTDVRFGSKADILASLHDVPFTPKSGHRSVASECPPSAKGKHFAIHSIALSVRYMSLHASSWAQEIV